MTSLRTMVHSGLGWGLGKWGTCFECSLGGGGGSHSWGWGQGSQDQKLLVSAQSWAHFTGGRLRPWPSWHQVLSQQLHPGLKVPLGLATFPAMSQGLRGWALGPAAQVPYPSMTSCVALGRHCTSLSLCGKKGESLRLREDVRIKQHPSHSFIHSLDKQVPSTYSVPGAVLGTRDTDGHHHLPQGLLF